MTRSADKNLLVLQWEAPVGRTPQDKIVVRVDELIEPDRGMLGSIENHPSMAHSMPNPIEIRGAVLHRSPGWTADAVKMKFPKYKLSDARVSDRLALAVVAKTTCICVARVPSEVPESGLEEWLKRWGCSE